jgi:hypothetical protein
MRDNSRRSGEAQKFLHRKVGKLHDFSIRPASPSMLFSCFSVIESLVSSHVAPLSGPLSHHRIHYSYALRYSYLCALIDRDGADFFRLDMLLINGGTVPLPYLLPGCPFAVLSLSSPSLSISPLSPLSHFHCLHPLPRLSSSQPRNRPCTYPCWPRGCSLLWLFVATPMSR